MGRKTILVVDDDYGIHGLIKIILRNNDCRLIFAATGEQAIAILKKEKIDIVITDYHMPSMNGLQLLQMMKDLFPFIKVIVMSSYLEQSKIVELLKHGASKFVNKFELVHEIPTIIKDLQEMITEDSEHKPPL